MLSKRINIQLTGTFIAAAGFLIFGVLVVIYGYATTQGAFEWTRLVEQLYSNFGIELVSIALTVLVIESLNQRRAERERVIREKENRERELHERIQREKEAEERAERERKEALILQMGSPDNAFAVEAARILQQKGWLKDGLLQGAHLVKAHLQKASLREVNLREANLWNANLQEAILWGANLQRTNLQNTNLQGANLESVKLQGAKLGFANLQGADLVGANLQGADLAGAKFDKNTILPDGTKWTPDTDMARFVDANHAQFWRSSSPSSPAYRGKPTNE